MLGQALGVCSLAGHPAEDRSRPIPTHSPDLSSGPHTHGKLAVIQINYDCQIVKLNERAILFLVSFHRPLIIEAKS